MREEETTQQTITPRYLNIKDAAHYMSLSESYLYQNKGETLPYIKAGNKVLFDVKDLDDFLNKRKVLTPEQIENGTTAA